MSKFYIYESNNIAIVEADSADEANDFAEHHNFLCYTVTELDSLTYKKVKQFFLRNTEKVDSPVENCIIIYYKNGDIEYYRRK